MKLPKRIWAAVSIFLESHQHAPTGFWTSKTTALTSRPQIRNFAQIVTRVWIEFSGWNSPNYRHSSESFIHRHGITWHPQFCRTKLWSFFGQQLRKQDLVTTLLTARFKLPPQNGMRNPEPNYAPSWHWQINALRKLVCIPSMHTWDLLSDLFQADRPSFVKNTRSFVQHSKFWLMKA